MSDDKQPNIRPTKSAWEYIGDCFFERSNILSSTLSIGNTRLLERIFPIGAFDVKSSIEERNSNTFKDMSDSITNEKSVVCDEYKSIIAESELNDIKNKPTVLRGKYKKLL
mgnify:CR=1 FL=1